MTLQAILAALLSLLAWFNVNAHQPAHTGRPAPQRASRGVERTHAVAAPTGGQNWAALRQCESGSNYANKRNPIYRGAYQFDRRTWAGVGGSGDPADASPDEQDRRARILFSQRGRAPWPVCGARL